MFRESGMHPVVTAAIFRVAFERTGRRQASIFMVHTYNVASIGLHADLFSRHASPLEGCVLVAIDEIGEYVMSDDICRRCNGKQHRWRRGGRSVQLPDWV